MRHDRKLLTLLACAALLAAMLLPPPAQAATRMASLIARAQKRELDAAEALLRKRLEGLPEGSDVVMLRDPDDLVLRVPARELFDADSTQLKPHAVNALPLSAVVELLRKRYHLVAQINVYTDNIGGTIANHGLSQQRAVSLMEVLHGGFIRPARVTGAGLGADAALASNETPEGRDQNRRVEVIFDLPGTHPH